MSKLFLSCRVPKLLILAGNSFIFALLKLPRVAWLSRFKGHGCTENAFKFTQPRSQAGYLLLFEGSSMREPGSEFANLSWSTFRVSEYPKTDSSFFFSGVDRLDRDLTIGQMQGLYRRQFFWIFFQSFKKELENRCIVFTSSRRKRDHSAVSCRSLTTTAKTWTKSLAPVVQKLDSAIHRINLYPVDSY